MTAEEGSRALSVLGKSQGHWHEYDVLPWNTDLDPDNMLQGSFNNYFPFNKTLGEQGEKPPFSGLCFECRLRGDEGESRHY